MVYERWPPLNIRLFPLCLRCVYCIGMSVVIDCLEYLDIPCVINGGDLNEMSQKRKRLDEEEEGSYKITSTTICLLTII